MVNYHLYLRLMSQFSYKNVAKFEVLGRELIVSRKEERWQISTLLSQGEDIPRDLIHFSEMRWLKQGAYLKVDTLSHTLHLIQEVRVPTYLSFKALMNDFLAQSEDWASYMQHQRRSCLAV